MKAWIRSALIVLLASCLSAPPAVASIAARVQAATNARKQAEQKQVEKVTVARHAADQTWEGRPERGRLAERERRQEPAGGHEFESADALASGGGWNLKNRRKNCSRANRGRNRRTTVPSRRIWPAVPTRDPSWRRTKRTWTQVLNRPPTTTSRPNPTRNQPGDAPAARQGADVPDVLLPASGERGRTGAPGASCMR